MVFAPPKGGGDDDPKDRFVPVDDHVATILSERIRCFPPVEVTLPWIERGGPPVTVHLVFATRELTPLNKNYINYLWKSALEAAGLIKAREAIGKRYDAAA